MRFQVLNRRMRRTRPNKNDTAFVNPSNHSRWGRWEVANLIRISHQDTVYFIVDDELREHLAVASSVDGPCEDVDPRDRDPVGSAVLVIPAADVGPYPIEHDDTVGL